MLTIQAHTFIVDESSKKKRKIGREFEVVWIKGGEAERRVEAWRHGDMCCRLDNKEVIICMHSVSYCRILLFALFIYLYNFFLTTCHYSPAI